MSHYVYMIKSIKHGKMKTYVGYTNNLKKRLNLHNRGKGAKFTRGRQWKVTYKEKYATKAITRIINESRRTTGS